MSKKKRGNNAGPSNPPEAASTEMRLRPRDLNGNPGTSTGDLTISDGAADPSVVDRVTDVEPGALQGDVIPLLASSFDQADAGPRPAESERVPRTDDAQGDTVPEPTEASEVPSRPPANEIDEPAAPDGFLRISPPDDQPPDGPDLEMTPQDDATDHGELSTERVVEAILFTSDAPLTLPRIVSIMGTGSAREVRKIIQELNKGYARNGNAFRIEEIAGGFQMLTLPEYNTWLRRLRQSRQDSKLSPAAMETLAVVAYKQPVVRAEVESIRGVSAGETLNRLRELGLVKIVGRAEDVGRPMLYGTTKHFLEVFGLSSLEDLPAVEELQAPK